MSLVRQFTGLDSHFYTVDFAELEDGSWTIIETGDGQVQSLRKLMEMPPRIIESKWEQTPEGGTELNYYNEDLCSYYLFRENDRSYNLNPGKNTVFRIEKGSNANNPFKIQVICM